MHIPCVLALPKDSLLGFTLANLINASDVGLVVCESQAQTLADLVKEIKDNQADVILLEKSSPFADEVALTKLLMVNPKLLMIIINENSNWFHIYRKEDVLMTSPEDIISAIKSA